MARLRRPRTRGCGRATRSTCGRRTPAVQGVSHGAASWRRAPRPASSSLSPAVSRPSSPLVGRRRCGDSAARPSPRRSSRSARCPPARTSASTGSPRSSPRMTRSTASIPRSQVPAIAPDDWRLRIHGMVDREVTLTLADLLAYPIDRARHHADLRLQRGRRRLRRQRALDRGPAGDRPGGGRRPGRRRPDRVALHRRHVDRHADRGRARRPRRDAGGRHERRAAAGRRTAIPVRMIVPGLYGYVSATKWLVELELTTFDAFDPYWVQRGWAKEGADQDDVADRQPRSRSPRSPPGKVAIAGVAWAQHRGIERVEVRVDGGPWTRRASPALDTIDTWRQWVLDWDATPAAATRSRSAPPTRPAQCRPRRSTRRRRSRTAPPVGTRSS